MSSSQFYKWLFGAENISRLLRNARQVSYVLSTPMKEMKGKKI